MRDTNLDIYRGLFKPLPIRRIYSHIWFILPYLLIALSLPPVYRYLRRYRIPFIAVFVGWALLLYTFHFPDLIQTVLVYFIFTIWGMYYKNKSGWQNGICVIAAACYLAYMVFVQEMPFDMQANKFPPNLLFASYGWIVLGIGGTYMQKGLVILYNRFVVVRRLIDVYSKEGYEIYLIHPFTTLLLAGFKHVLGLNPIIAGHWYLKISYVVVGFLFLLYGHLLVLRLYNWGWSMIIKYIRCLPNQFFGKRRI